VLKEFQERRFDDVRFPVIYIDGIEYAGETLVGVIGIDMAGNKVTSRSPEATCKL
jgi:hypothetical protein